MYDDSSTLRDLALNVSLLTKHVPSYWSKLNSCIKPVKVKARVLAILQKSSELKGNY